MELVEANALHFTGQPPRCPVARPECEPGLVTKMMDRPQPAAAPWRRMKPWLLLILLCGALLRLYGLSAESVWLDEATSILLGQEDIASMVRATAQDIHPPLYYGLLHFWMCLLGTSEFAARALSVCIGLTSIAVIYQLGRRLFGEQTGVVAAILLAVSPLHVWYSQETRMYALVALWTMAGSFWLWRALRRRRAPYWIAYAACMALGLYTHYHALFVLLFQACFMVIWWLLSSREKRLARDWLLAEVGIALLFLPWVPVLLEQIARGGGSWIAKGIFFFYDRAILDMLILFSVGSVRQWYPIWVRRSAYVLFAGSLVLATMAALRKWRQQPRSQGSMAYLFTGMYLVVSLGAVWLVSQFKPMYARRYLLPFLPPYLLLIAAGSREIPWRVWRTALLFGLAAVCLTGVALAAYYPQKDDWRTIARYVLREAQPTDVVVLSPPWNYKPFDYYAHGQLTLYRRLPVPVPEEEDCTSLLGEAMEGHGRLWLIWPPGHYADPLASIPGCLSSRFPLLLSGDFANNIQVRLYEIPIPR